MLIPMISTKASKHKNSPPNIMHLENRRSFVKKSLATSISISFAGLIRAHGEEGGTTTTNTTAWETTAGTTELGTTNTTAWETTAGPTYATTSDPWGTTYETTAPETTADPFETTIEPTTVETTMAVFDLIGTAKAGSTAIAFDNTGYGQLPTDWAVGSVFKYKLKFFASSVDGENTPHGNPLKIEAAGEYYKIGGATQHTTDRFGLECNVIDQSDGTISSDLVGQIPEFLVQTGVAAKVDIENEDEEIIGYYLLYPTIKITNLEVTESPEADPTSATMTGRVYFWTGVKKYEKNSAGEFVEITPYDSESDPNYPGGLDFHDFEVTILSHVHVSL